MDSVVALDVIADVVIDDVGGDDNDDDDVASAFSCWSSRHRCCSSRDRLEGCFDDRISDARRFFSILL